MKIIITTLECLFYHAVSYFLRQGQVKDQATASSGITRFTLPHPLQLPAFTNGLFMPMFPRFPLCCHLLSAWDYCRQGAQLAPVSSSLGATGGNAPLPKGRGGETGSSCRCPPTAHLHVCMSGLLSTEMTSQGFPAAAAHCVQADIPTIAHMH